MDDVPQEATGKYPVRAEWSGFLTPTETGNTASACAFKRVRESLGERETRSSRVAGADDVGETKVGHIHLDQGKKVFAQGGLLENQRGSIRAQMIWSKYDPKPSSEAIAAAQDADVVVAVLGITSELKAKKCL